MKKNIITKTLSVLMLSISFYSCSDVLDLNSTKEVSDLYIWNTEMAAEMYITAAYKTFSDVSQVANSRGQFFDSYSDIMKSTSWDQYGHGYNKSLLEASAFRTGGAGAFECWSDVYGRIRRANVLLKEIDLYAVSRYGEDWCNVRRAEVRLCRAFCYYRLIRVYGGIVLRTDKTGVNGVDDGAFEVDIHRKRLSEEESWNFVLDELLWAAQYLPSEWPSSWQGRATKKTAYGLISRIALYPKQWQLVIDASNKVKELGGALATDYGNIFNSDAGLDNSKEVLFALYYKKGSVTHKFDVYNRPFGDNAIYNSTVYAEHVPTAELADLYEFKDGTPFDWNAYTESHSDPYTDREPRFHATILYNGCKWENRTIHTDTEGADSFLAFTQSGSTNGHTCTGYYLRKFLQENNTSFHSDYSDQYDPILRYAEVLLNKAEAYAQIDYGKYQSDALNALNEVRSRVGLPGRKNEDAADKESFMELLRREKCVEFAGEGLRFWDLRRWKLADEIIHGNNAHGVKISKNGEKFSYQRVECDGGTPRIFLDKYYYYSLPTSETANNKLCENNPYW